MTVKNGIRCSHPKKRDTSCGSSRLYPPLSIATPLSIVSLPPLQNHSWSCCCDLLNHAACPPFFAPALCQALLRCDVFFLSLYFLCSSHGTNMVKEILISTLSCSPPVPLLFSPSHRPLLLFFFSFFCRVEYRGYRASAVLRLIFGSCHTKTTAFQHHLMNITRTVLRVILSRGFHPVTFAVSRFGCREIAKACKWRTCLPVLPLYLHHSLLDDCFRVYPRSFFRRTFYFC